MSTARPDRFAMTTLRGDLPAASALAVFLLVVQLFVAGLAAGEAQGGFSERHLCTAAADHAGSSRDREGHRRDCPCLAAGCCATPLGGPPSDGGPFLAAPTPILLAAGNLGRAAEPERRPLRLFARAGRGPPRIA